MILTVILGIAFVAMAALFCGMFVSREHESRRADENEQRAAALASAYNCAIANKASKDQRITELEAEIEELRAALTLAGQQLAFSSPPDVPAAEVTSLDPSKERLPIGIATNRYDCEPYSFPAGTQQAMLQEDCITDSETGVRCWYDCEGVKYFCAALGGAYGIDIGDAWLFTLKNGYTFPIIRADYQHSIDDVDQSDFGELYEYDDSGNVIDVLRNYDGEPCCHVLEFVVNMDAIPRSVKDAGGLHGLEKFGGKFGSSGNIEKIIYLGRKWQP